MVMNIDDNDFTKKREKLVKIWMYFIKNLT